VLLTASFPEVLPCRVVEIFSREFTFPLLLDVEILPCRVVVIFSREFTLPLFLEVELLPCRVVVIFSREFTLPLLLVELIVEERPDELELIVLPLET